MLSQSYSVTDWREELPPDHAHRDVADLCIDGADRVYLFVRTDQLYESEVLVYERDGRFVRAWGRGRIKNAHGISLGPDGSVYCVDNYEHTVRKFSPTGELLLELGTPDVPSDTGFDRRDYGTVARSAGPFNGCTKVAVAPSGDFYVTDGYGNCCVHQYSPTGELRRSWGEPGTGPGQFHLPHGVWVTGDGRLIVADRENDRLQFFDPDGAFLAQWTDVHCPTNVQVVGDRLYVVELSTRAGRRSFVHGVDEEARAGRVSVFTTGGELLARWGEVGNGPGQFIAPHGLAVDSHGDVYVSETTWTLYGRYGQAPEQYNQIQKFTRDA